MNSVQMEISHHHDLDTAEARAITDQIKAAVGDLMILVAKAWQGRVWVALNYDTWADYIRAEFHHAPLALPREERQAVAALLKGQGMSTRAIGPALGVDRQTVANDLAGGKFLPPDEPVPVTGLDGKNYTVTCNKLLGARTGAPTITTTTDRHVPYVRRHRKGHGMNKVHGIKVDEISHKEPGNGLPKWVKEAAATRGYGDALEPLSLYVTATDIAAAFDCAAHGNGAKCVMAQAGQRLGAKAVYFYRTTAWVDFGTGPILRFHTARSIFNNVIEPFDRGDREAVTGGIYPLMPPTHSQSLKRRRQYDKTDRKNSNNPNEKKVVSHTDRVVMAAQA